MAAAAGALLQVGQSFQAAFRRPARGPVSRIAPFEQAEDEPPFGNPDEVFDKGVPDAWMDHASTACPSGLSTSLASRPCSRRSSRSTIEQCYTSLVDKRTSRMASAAWETQNQGVRRPRFSLQALSQMWEVVIRDLDDDTVSMKEFVRKMKETEDLYSMMVLLTKYPLAPVPACSLAPSPSKHQGMREMKQLCREIDWDKKSNLDFSGFVRTFKKHGMFTD